MTIHHSNGIIERGNLPVDGIQACGNYADIGIALLHLGLHLIELIKLGAGLVGIQLNLPRSLAHLPLSALLFGAHLIGRAVLLRR